MSVYAMGVDSPFVVFMKQLVRDREHLFYLIFCRIIIQCLAAVPLVTSRSPEMYVFFKLNFMIKEAINLSCMNYAYEEQSEPP